MVRRCTSNFEDNTESARSETNLIEAAATERRERRQEHFVDEAVDGVDAEDINFDPPPYQSYVARDGVTNTSYESKAPKNKRTGNPSWDFFKSVEVTLQKRTTFTREEIECIVSEHS